MLVLLGLGAWSASVYPGTVVNSDVEGSCRMNSSFVRVIWVKPWLLRHQEFETSGRTHCREYWGPILCHL